MTTFKTFKQLAASHETIPVTETFFTDILTPVHMFHALKDKATYILESQDPESEWSNYSFIGLEPMCELTETDGTFILHDFENKITETFGDLTTAFNEAIHYFNAYTDDIDLPFKGGAVGYMSYDAISDFAPVAPRGNDDTNYHFMFCKTLLAYHHRTKETTIVSYARIGEEEKLKRLYEERLDYIHEIKKKLATKSSLRDLMLSGDTGSDHPVEVKSNYTRDQFIADVHRIKDYIYAGDVLQTVLSQRFSVDTQCTGFELYRVLRNVNPAPYMFYMTLGDKTLIGSSPERQLEVHDGVLEMHPIAGTRKRGSTAEEDDALATELLNDSKERSEHRMLVDLARNDIGQVAKYGSVDVSRYMTIGRFAKVMHIISVVNGELADGVTPIDAFISAFPAGTLSGAPKVRAMQILRELEPTPRGVYGGSILYAGFDGNMDSCITIRTMTLTDGTVHIQAGAGVVADSDPKAEYEETVNKASALVRTLQIAETVFENDHDDSGTPPVKEDDAT